MSSSSFTSPPPLQAIIFKQDLFDIPIAPSDDFFTNSSPFSRGFWRGRSSPRFRSSVQLPAMPLYIIYFLGELKIVRFFRKKRTGF
ncbi:hypothetical protein COCNU_contig69392335G000010 [Cocos nucifera]|nr:hypothetical protein [Cocos nucifera]